MSGLVNITRAQHANALQTRKSKGQVKGIADAVREVVAQQRVPLSLIKRRLESRFTPEQVAYCVYGLVRKGVLEQNSTTGILSLAAQPAGPGAPLPMMNPLRRDLFENWRLCARDPFETSRAAVLTHRGCA